MQMPEHFQRELPHGAFGDLREQHFAQLGEKRSGQAHDRIRHDQQAHAAHQDDRSGILRASERGQVLAKPGSIKPHTKFKGEVYILSKEEGGRHTPFFNGYRPQFYLRTTDVTGTLNLPEGVEMVMPGDNTTISGELMAPVALEKGARFAIREGGRTVGAGAITEIVE